MTTLEENERLRHYAPGSATAGPAAADDLTPRTRLLLQGPVLGTLLRLALPNLGEAAARITFIAFDAIFVGWLGTDALAGVSLAFPVFLLMQLMSASGLGAGVASAVARAMGGGRHDDAEALAGHGLVLALVAALIFAAIMLLYGSPIYRAMGAGGADLRAALIYSNLVFAGIAAVWLMNILANVVRGTGNMVIPASAIIIGEMVHLVVSPVLILGLGPFPSLGVAGAAIAVLASYSAGTVFLLGYLLLGRGSIRLTRHSFRLRWAHFYDILRVGALGSVNAAQMQLIAVGVTSLIASFGTAALAGYGAASRLELLQLPLTFALGTAIIAMVGTNIGAGQHERVRHIATTGTLLCLLIGGAFGAVALGLPRAWLSAFSQETAVIDAGSRYLLIAGISYPFLGGGLGLLFAMLGAGRAVAPFLASTLRLLCVIGGGWLLVQQAVGGQTGLFALITAATVLFALAMLVAGRDLMRWPARAQPGR